MTEHPYPFTTDLSHIPEWLLRLSIPEIVALLSRDTPKFNRTYSRTIFRIEKETRVLKPCQDLGMMSDIYYGFDSEVGQTSVDWNSPSSYGDGQFDFLENRIASPWPPPSKQLILTELAATGKFPFTVDMITHELVHKKQLPPAEIQKLITLLFLQPATGDKFFPGKELMEIIAYRLTSLEPQEATPEYLAQHLITAKDKTGQTAYADLDPQKLHSSIEAVDALLALGIDTVPLCRLAYQPGGWDKIHHNYPHLTRVVRELANEKGQPLEILPTLKRAYILRRLQETNLCKTITQTEIISAVSA